MWYLLIEKIQRSCQKLHKQTLLVYPCYNLYAPVSCSYMSCAMLCFAHRGASGYETENSMSSFRKAIDLGAPWIELDVRSVDGHAAVYHDAKLNRLTECKEAISSISLASLRTLRLPNGEGIPMLREVLATFCGQISLQIELKGAGAAEATATELSIALDEGWKTSQLLVSSFDQEELILFRQLHPSIPVGLLVYGYQLNCINTALQLGATSIHINLDAVSLARINAIHENGLKVYVYTVNDRADISYLQSLGVDGIFTDYPDRALRFTRKQP